MDRVDPKNLYEEVSVGDKLDVSSRDEPLTVYRHVTEEDYTGQVITMSSFDDAVTSRIQHPAEVDPGDLTTGELTGEEFLVLRGPQDGAYIITQWWDKTAGRWSADLPLYRRTRDGSNKHWQFEETVSLEVIGSEDVDPEAFDHGIESAVPSDERYGRTAWENHTENEVYHEYPDGPNGEDFSGEIDNAPEIEIGDEYTRSDGQSIEVVGEEYHNGVRRLEVERQDSGSTVTWAAEFIKEQYDVPDQPTETDGGRSAGGTEYDQRTKELADTVQSKSMSAWKALADRDLVEKHYGDQFVAGSIGHPDTAIADMHPVLGRISSISADEEPPNPINPSSIRELSDTLAEINQYLPPTEGASAPVDEARELADRLEQQESDEGETGDDGGETPSDGGEGASEHPVIAPDEIVVGMAFETDDGETLRVTNERDDEVCVFYPGRHDPSGGSFTRWSLRESLADRVNYEGMSVTAHPSRDPSTFATREAGDDGSETGSDGREGGGADGREGDGDEVPECFICGSKAYYKIDKVVDDGVEYQCKHHARNASDDRKELLSTAVTRHDLVKVWTDDGSYIGVVEGKDEDAEHSDQTVFKVNLGSAGRELFPDVEPGEHKDGDVYIDTPSHVAKEHISHVESLDADQFPANNYQLKGHIESSETINTLPSYHPEYGEGAPEEAIALIEEIKEASGSDRPETVRIDGEAREIAYWATNEDSGVGLENDVLVEDTYLRPHSDGFKVETERSGSGVVDRRLYPPSDVELVYDHSDSEEDEEDKDDRLIETSEELRNLSEGDRVLVRYTSAQNDSEQEFEAEVGTPEFDTVVSGGESFLYATIPVYRDDDEITRRRLDVTPELHVDVEARRTTKQGAQWSRIDKATKSGTDVLLLDGDVEPTGADTQDGSDESSADEGDGNEKPHPSTLEEGDELRFRYDPKNGDTRQTVTGTVTKVKNEAPNIENDHYYVYLTTGEYEPTRELYERTESDRRLIYMMDSYHSVEGRNGGRWNSLSTVGPEWVGVVSSDDGDHDSDESDESDDQSDDGNGGGQGDERVAGSFVETPQCPECGSFMSTGFDGMGLPAADCPDPDCGSFMDDQELIEGGYFEEGSDDDDEDVEPYQVWMVHRDSGTEHLVPERYAGQTECGTYVNALKADDPPWPLTESSLEKNPDACERCIKAADEAKLEAGYEQLVGEDSDE